MARQEIDPRLMAPEPSRRRVAVGAAVVLVLVGLGVSVLSALLAPRGESVELAAAPSGPPPSILVHVLGAVARPGLYELAEGSRVVDALTAAGGFAEDADRGAINLARVLGDAEQVVVPVLGAVEGSAGAVAGDGRVNLNTADAAALDTLPRIGPALAARIIAWREANGGFRSVEDLLDVGGIGSTTLEGLRPLVTV